MSEIVVSTVIRAPLDRVWAAAADLRSHLEWMADAESITMDSAESPGIGTRMTVATRVGPFRTTDVMEVIAWEPPHAIGVNHKGLVSGRGRFELAPVAGGTRFSWVESLRFPLWLGGPVTAWAARPVLAWIWRRNLRSLKERLEAPPPRRR